MDRVTTDRFHAAGTVLFAAALFLMGLFGVHDNLAGSTASAALLPGDRTDAPDTVATTLERGTHEATPRITKHVHPTKVPVLPPERIDTETLWLARCIYSETKRPEEQELVAWVVRNRVETGYRGKRSYRSVVLDPYQFSAFNPQSRKRDFYTDLDRGSDAPGWQRALSIAFRVRHATPELRPFPETTRHFFSERSMVDRRHPNWAHDKPDVDPGRYTISKERFRFYSNVM